MPKNFDRQLTELELELMQIVWSLQECSIRGIFDALPDDRELAYTTVATMVKILEQKGAISCQKIDRTITVKPKIDRATYEETSLKYLNEKVFKGNASSMVTRLLDVEDLSVGELKEIKKLLNERLRS
ncbi:MAG: BlaI/MecI/CopY family transcriptional regulator [Bdellovibrionaceae bacterium]|nr:BlaI/MecI/CopY family transcriptional regulator [Pseudobdellovibrionaceae bacterium]